MAYAKHFWFRWKAARCHASFNLCRPRCLCVRVCVCACVRLCVCVCVLNIDNNDVLIMCSDFSFQLHWANILSKFVYSLLSKLNLIETQFWIFSLGMRLEQKAKYLEHCWELKFLSLFACIFEEKAIIVVFDWIVRTFIYQVFWKGF